VYHHQHHHIESRALHPSLQFTHGSAVIIDRHYHGIFNNTGGIAIITFKFYREGHFKFQVQVQAGRIKVFSFFATLVT